jgi:hypothetical protein
VNCHEIVTGNFLFDAYGRSMNIEQAKRVPIEEMLARLGHLPKRQRTNELWYASPFRPESKPSYKINRTTNLWYDFGEGRGGDVIDLVQRVERLANVSDTLARMDDLIGSVEPPPLPKLEPVTSTTSPGLELVRAGPVQARSLLAYLKQRGIELKTVADQLQEVHYRHGENEYFALGIPNESGSFEIRNRFFKGTVGKKDISVIPGDAKHVAVFEGMFDYLTAMQLAGGKLAATAIVLNSVSLRDRVIARIQQLGAQQVDLYRDNDPAGEQLLTAFREALPSVNVADMAESYLGYRDLNGEYVTRHVSRT